ncbi:hypothetical protein SAMN05216270_12917 [Glycomyces harbinensis]|uniref:Uncharacterized protein n=1 Tax=Glycomyces harbinensis TaxID=58114 RepID=A0A1G7DVJ4_9ACTN|nr:hypothetical protein SAMN05216270_12917 [Glycomyces harbinensis]
MFGIWREDDDITMMDLGSLTKLLLTAEQSGQPIGTALGLVARFAQDETLDDLGVSDPTNLIAIVLRVETWMVDAADNDISLDLAKLLTGEHRMKEHPNATTAFACWAHCVDGTGHEAVWRELESAPRSRVIPAGNRQWRTDQIPKGLQQLLKTIIDLRRRGTGPI